MGNYTINRHTMLKYNKIDNRDGNTQKDLNVFDLSKHQNENNHKRKILKHAENFKQLASMCLFLQK